MIARARGLAAMATLLVLCGGNAVAGTRSVASHGPNPRFVPGELLVRFASGAGPAERARALREVDAGAGRSLRLAGLRLIEADGVSVEDAVARLEREPGVLYAEPNYVISDWAMTPDDVYFPSQWALENTGLGIDNPPVFGTPDADIDAASAWATSVGSAKTIIGIADTGVFYNHPDLAGNVYANPGESGGEASNGIDDDGNGYVDDFRGWDFLSDDNDAAPANPPASLDRHGTLVASAAGAQGNNSVGVTGASQEVSLLPLRIGDAASGAVVSNQVLAYRYAGELGAQVVSLSAGGGVFSQAVLDAIRAAPDTLFVFAAGNGGADKIGDDNDASPQYPCNLDEPNVICLAATDQDDKLAGFSNFGAASVDLAAPGVNILAANIGTDPANSYEFADGTSLAAPIAAGAAAVYRSLYPQATAAQTADALRTGVDPRASLSGKVATGGRLNLDRALDVEPPPDTSIALALDVAQTQKIKRLEATVGCGAEACEGELGGVIVAKERRGGTIVLKARRTSRRFKLKSARFALTADQEQTLGIRLKRHSRSIRTLRKLLRRRAYRHSTRAKITASASDQAGNEASARVKVSLKR